MEARLLALTWRTGAPELLTVRSQHKCYRWDMLPGAAPGS